MEQLIIFLATFLFPPLFSLVLLVVLLATFGKSLGIRKTMVNVLIRLFEWGATELRRADAEARRERNELARQSSNRSVISLDLTNDSTDSTCDRSLRSDNQPSPVVIERKVSVEERTVIKCDATERILRKLQPHSQPQFGRVFTIADDSLDFMKAGVEAIIEDEVTSRFLAEDLASWNLLTRTGIKYYHISWKLGALWLFGLIFRYLFLFPMRLMLLTMGLIFLISSTAIVGYIPDPRLKKWANYQANIISHRICSRAISAIITFHNTEHMAKNGSICVANHTSPIDVILLSCDNCYAMIGQKQGGLLGVIQRALARASAHIWFERSEAADRAAVSNRIRNHCADPKNLPILIFPEGTCINNTVVMQFKKGSFEVGAPIYPVAIKYDPRFGDPFWNSSEQGWTQYIISMMTSWAIVADVWYLPVMTMKEGEDSIQFANRVKKAIAECGGLVEMDWDGQLKRMKVPEKIKQRQQKLYSDRLQRIKNLSYTDMHQMYTPGLVNHDDVLDELVDELIEEEMGDENSNHKMGGDFGIGDFDHETLNLNPGKLIKVE